MPLPDPEEQKEYLKNWREGNPDYMSNWNEENKERKQELNKQYNEENALREKARKAAWYEANKEKKRQAQRAYRERKRQENLREAIRILGGDPDELERK